MADLPVAPEPQVLHEELERLRARAQARREPDVPTKIPSLAREVGLSAASVYAYFSGETVPSALVLEDILSRLGVREASERRRFGQLRDDAVIARKRDRRTPRSLPAEPDPVLDNLPGKSGAFFGRDVAALLRQVAHHGQVAIHGEGGTGKTEFALQYAHAYRQHGGRRVAWWIDGGSPRQVTVGLAGLARRIQPKTLRRDAVAAEWAINWLQSNQQWLLVLDNVTSLEDVAGILSELRDCGALVVTTRLNPGPAEWRRSGLHPLPLGALDRADSAALLLALTESSDRAGAELLAQEAGDLPLALRQAAAFITQHPGTGFREYRQQLADELDRDTASASATRGRSGRTIAATWTIAMRRASATAPLSSEIMAVLAYLAGDSLPGQAFEKLGEPTEVARALDCLAAYLLITRDGTDVTAHRLVQAAARMTDAEPAAHRAAGAVLLGEVIPQDPLVNTEGWPRWRALAPHIEALAARLPAEEQSVSSLRVRERYAAFLEGQGNITRAITVLESAVADAERVLGPQHPDTRDYTANLALAYVAAARITPALAMLSDLAPAYIQTIGPTNPETLQIRAVLANAHRLRGNPEKAAEQLKQVIADAEGTDLDVETAQTFLAAAYTDAGRLGEAIGMLQQTSAQQCRSLGDRHPKTLVTRHNLARALRESGEADAAMSQFRDVLAAQRETLGISHPHTLTTRGNLALTEQAQGRLEEAIAQFDALLFDTQQTLGREHPATLTTLRYLANAHLANGQTGEAIPLLEAALAEHARLLGNTEPLTFLARRDLAAAYRQAAHTAYNALLDDQEQVLGPLHRETATTRREAQLPPP